MNNIKIAMETIRITAQGYYEKNGRKIQLPERDYSAVKVYSPEKGAALVSSTVIPENGELCRIEVTGEDSFQAARRFERPFVMNFANAHKPGGGFTLGANAQEEALCRCSTLYGSIRSESSAEMYRCNNTHPSMVESDYMLLSEDVSVFRDEKCQFLDEPFSAAVITVPAPNRHGAAFLASSAFIAETMTRRIRIMLAIAAENGYRSLVLGAWGCGAFGNKAKEVSEYFRRVLIDEGWGRLFDNVCFAVYGSPDSRNRRTFCECFEKK